MPKSIAVFGAGPGLGRAVARRYAQEGYDVVLVARRGQPLDSFAKDLAGMRERYVITADLAETDAAPELAERVRAAAGELDALYYGPTRTIGFVPAAERRTAAQDWMPLIFYSLVALVQQFLPHMIEQGSGAILTAQGTARARPAEHERSRQPGRPTQFLAVPTLRSGRQRRLRRHALHRRGHRGERLPRPDRASQGRGAGRDWGPTVDPAHLAELLWDMHGTKSPAEAKYP